MHDKTHTVLAIFHAKPGKEQALEELLSSLIEPTRSEEGCINYDLHKCLDDPGKFMFYENWINQEAHAKHLTTPHIQQWRAKKDELLFKPADVSGWKKIKL